MGLPLYAYCIVSQSAESGVYRLLIFPRPGCQWKHEDGSELMFDSLVESNNINLPLADAQFIKALIAGERGQCP